MEACYYSEICLLSDMEKVGLELPSFQTLRTWASPGKVTEPGRGLRPAKAQLRRHVTYSLILQNVTGTAFESRALSPPNVLAFQLSTGQAGASNTCIWVSMRVPVSLGVDRLHSG